MLEKSNTLPMFLPIVTIGMPVYNDVDFIEDSIKSIINQSYSNFKLIISDDRSTDGSDLVCLRYAKKDPRITYIKQDLNLGISRNMQFLLSMADTPYFMWAGDDDLIHRDFLLYHIGILEKTPQLVSAFCPCALINENSELLVEKIVYNYQNTNLQKRLRNYIANSSDYFGYGLFRTDSIKGVKFPVWWWPNKKTPYNNIYPTLLYYLAKGDFALCSNQVLFYKRVKSEKKTNHLLTGKNNAIKESLAFWIRRLNLVCFSFTQVKSAVNYRLALLLIPDLLYYWFFIPSWDQFVLVCRSFVNRFKSISN